MAFLDDYETVEDRLAKFWADNAEGGRVMTEVKALPDGTWYVIATVYKTGRLEPIATGIATPDPTKKNWMAEDCETSAIGRALANAGYAPKGKRPSREEMQKSGGAATQTRSESIPKSSSTAAPPNSPPASGGPKSEEAKGVRGSASAASSSSSPKGQTEDLQDKAKAIPLRGELKRLSTQLGQNYPANIEQMKAAELEEAVSLLKRELNAQVVGELPNN